MLVHARQSQIASEVKFKDNANLVRWLNLTDLCIFTEARYTRHPAMADFHAAFQDHPLAMDHFPSGSLVSPPSFRHRAP